MKSGFVRDAGFSLLWPLSGIYGAWIAQGWGECWSIKGLQRERRVQAILRRTGGIVAGIAMTSYAGTGSWHRKGEQCQNAFTLSLEGCAMNKSYFRVFESDKDGQWYITLVAANGEPVARGEGYATRQGALKGVGAICRAAAEAEVRLEPLGEGGGAA